MNDENAWVFQAQQGSDEAFTQLVEMYQKPVYNLCYRMLGEPETADTKLVQIAPLNKEQPEVHPAGFGD